MLPAEFRLKIKEVGKSKRQGWDFPSQKYEGYSHNQLVEIKAKYIEAYRDITGTVQGE